MFFSGKKIGILWNTYWNIVSLIGKLSENEIVVGLSKYKTIFVTLKNVTSIIHANIFIINMK
jgi:hypothetical protein